MRNAIFVCALAVLGACSVPNATFTGDDDGSTIDGGGDDDGNGEVALVVTPSDNLDVTEGRTATFTVGLTETPSGLVTVSVMSGDTSVATVTPATLVFDSSEPKTVTVTGIDDENTNDGSTEIALASAEAGNANLPITVLDDDELAIVATPTSVDVTEEDMSTVDVTLSVQPPAAVTVMVIAADGTIATATPASLTFDGTNWNQPQAVTIRGTNDADTAHETTLVTLRSSPLNDVALSVDVTDNDQVSISPSPTNLGTITEAGNDSFTVVLTQQPTAAVTVTVTSSDPGALSVSTASIGFTTANWDQPQTVNVNAMSDDDANDENVTISLESTGLTTRTVSATVDDNDTLGIQTNVNSLVVAELNGGSNTFQVRLTAQPDANTTVTIDPSAAGAVTLSTTSLVFTPANWDTFQSVTVTSVADDDAVDDLLDITCSALGMADKVVGVTVDDDDVLAITTTPSTTVAVTEGSVATVQVKLTAQPPASTTVQVASNDSAVTIAGSPLTFTTANWNTFQNVTLTGAQDDGDVINESASIVFSATGLSDKTVTANVTDNDTLIISATPSTFNLAEGATGSISVVLDKQPGANVTVNVSSNDTTAATVSPATLTFTPANYNTAQSVTVTGVEENTDFQNETVTISFSATGATGDSTTVNMKDNDLINVSPTSISTCVNGANVPVDVKLNAQPSANMTVTITNNSSAFTVSATSLTFTTANWNTVQTIQVNGSLQGSGTFTLSATGQATRTVSVSVAAGFCGN
jgi:large repetitive protein